MTTVINKHQIITTVIVWKTLNFNQIAIIITIITIINQIRSWYCCYYSINFLFKRNYCNCCCLHYQMRSHIHFRIVDFIIGTKIDCSYSSIVMATKIIYYWNSVVIRAVGNNFITKSWIIIITTITATATYYLNS